MLLRLHEYLDTVHSLLQPYIQEHCREFYDFLRVDKSHLSGGHHVHHSSTIVGTCGQKLRLKSWSQVASRSNTTKKLQSLSSGNSFAVLPDGFIVASSLSYWTVDGSLAKAHTWPRLGWPHFLQWYTFLGFLSITTCLADPPPPAVN